MGGCRRAGSGSLGGGAARRGANVRPGCGAQSAAAAGHPERPAGRRVGARGAALAQLRSSAPSPPALSFRGPGREAAGGGGAGEGRGGAARTDGRAGLWRCARGAGPAGGAGPEAQGSAKVTAARGRDGSAKSPAAAAREGLSRLGSAPSTRVPGSPSELSAPPRPRNCWSRGKCLQPQDLAGGAQLNGPAQLLVADPPKSWQKRF